MVDPHVLFIGTGSLSRAICYAASVLFTTPCRITLVSRSSRNAQDVAYVAGTQAARLGTPVDFRAVGVDDYSATAIRSLLQQLKPTIAVNCASHHSPWEGTRTPSLWTSVIARAGFGVTLPLQADIAIGAARGVQSLSEDIKLVNACFPDAVNPVLKALGLPIHCGLGNVAILAASVSAGLGVRDQAHPKVLGHHYHLHEPADPADEARAWSQGRPVTDVAELLHAQRQCTRSELNIINGRVSAEFLNAMVGGHTLHASLPGPDGLPGGYPVTVKGPELSLNLPADMALRQAQELNQRWAALDGVTVSDKGKVTFTGDNDFLAKACREADLTELPGKLDVDELQDAAHSMRRLRDRLRHSPAPSQDHLTGR